MTIFGIITTVLAVCGVVLNNRLDIRCFYVWMVSNVISTIIHIISGLWPLAIRDIIFCVLCIDGYKKWSKRNNENS